MRREIVSLVVVAAIGVCAGGVSASAAKSRTPVTASAKKLKMSPQELRIRVRALIRPTLGIVEETADRALRETTDPKIRRGSLVWRIETTTTLLSAMLRNDPLLALADAWGYAIQVENLLVRPEVAAKFGTYASDASAAMARIQAQFRAFAGSIQADLTGEAFEAAVRQWADRNPIEGALYRRPSMDSAVADVLAKSGGGGTFAALGNLDETTADVMTRMDLYTMYLPRLARWEAQLAIDDVAAGVDSKSVIAELELFTRAADRIAAVAEGAPEMVARERAAALEGVRAERLAATLDLQGERRAVLDAVRGERIATLEEVEAIAQRLVDRSSGPLHAAAREDMEELLRSVESMRRRLIEEVEVTLNSVVDHAFLRGVELLLIAAALGAAGVIFHARFLRR